VFVIIVRFSYIYVSQGSVKMHLWCVGKYNNHIIANCPQSVPVTIFFNRSIIGENMDKSKVPRFSWPTVHVLPHLCVSLTVLYGPLTLEQKRIQKTKLARKFSWTAVNNVAIFRSQGQW